MNAIRRAGSFDGRRYPARLFPARPAVHAYGLVSLADQAQQSGLEISADSFGFVSANPEAHRRDRP
ncbi:MAG TPA: hypothetical protein VGQ30_04525, partial [Gemmatimonadaceae bacterium]|nr:hypothetical protein [Gemmatimonadaceae bacterium]